MAKITDVNTLLDQLNTATNDVAADVAAQKAEIENLKEQIGAGVPVTQPQLDALAARLGENVARLQALAADPENPVPGAGDNPAVPGTVG